MFENSGKNYRVHEKKTHAKFRVIPLVRGHGTEIVFAEKQRFYRHIKILLFSIYKSGKGDIAENTSQKEFFDRVSTILIRF